jgi:hypothetical protein
MRGFNEKLFGDKLVAGQLPTQLGLIGSTSLIFPILDLYPGAAAAYSLRLLRTLYTGYAIRVRRSSDNAESDIGFSGENLDTSALNTFCTGTNGFVTTWYDQSGNANNATQTTAANQPQIVSSGNIINVNLKPCVQFTNSMGQFFQVNNNIFTYTGNATIFHTSRNRSTSANYGPIISYFEGALRSIALVWQQYPNTSTQASTDIYWPAGVSTTLTQSVNTQLSATYQWQNFSTHNTNGNTIIAINGANQSLTAYGGQNPNTWQDTGNTKIGRFDGSSSEVNNFLGDIQEIIVYTTALSGANIDGAESNINTYYGIY